MNALFSYVARPQCYVAAAMLLFSSDRMLAANPLYDAAYTNEVYGKYDEAISGYQAVLKDATFENLWPKTLLRLGLTYRTVDKNKEAAATFESLASKYPEDPRTPEALWYAMTTYSGPLNDRASGLRIAQLLHQKYPKDQYGERALYGEAFLHFVEKDRVKTIATCQKYLEVYPDGKYREGANEMIKKIEAQP